MWVSQRLTYFLSKPKRVIITLILSHWKKPSQNAPFSIKPHLLLCKTGAFESFYTFFVGPASTLPWGIVAVWLTLLGSKDKDKDKYKYKYK